MKIHLTVFLLLATIITNAQFTITGKVVDEQNEPLPFVSIHIINENRGTITNNYGKFSLPYSTRKVKIQISSLGFAPELIKVSPKTKYLTIVLKEENSLLEEVIIVTKPKKRLKKKENPAYRILKEIWSRKNKNGLKLVDAYQYKKKLNTEIGLNNLDTTFLNDLFKGNYKSQKNSEINYHMTKQV